jgi:putative DNA primase/helicase
MSAETVARALGGEQRSATGWRCRCPVHNSKQASLALRDGDRGLLVKCFGGCDWRDVFGELRRRGLLPQRDPDEYVPPPDPETVRRRIAAEAAARKSRLANALDLFFRGSRRAGGTWVETYFRSRELGIEIPPTIRASNNYLRHRETGETRPCMVALVQHVEHGRVGVHLTYLAPDGSQKATLDPPRRFLGPVAGGAVRLAAAAETLMVGEGIETCFAAMQATALPAWAACSTSGLRALVLPPLVKNVIILVDNDPNGAGDAAARCAGYRLLAEGRGVKMAIPPAPGTDFNDVLMMGERDVMAA